MTPSEGNFLVRLSRRILDIKDGIVGRERYIKIVEERLEKRMQAETEKKEKK